MAKEDFCFTYYDGDATRDTSHMNRLERGAYHDIIISQRKFGHLTLEQIKKILGKDFVECWPPIELVMKVEDGKYFIEWLENSILLMRKHSKKQSGNREGKTKQEPDLTKQEPKLIQTQPLEDESVNEDDIELKLKESINEIYIDGQRNKWKHLDFDLEVLSFFEKVRGSPEDYLQHDANGLRKALQYQLRNAKKKNVNGHTNKTAFGDTVPKHFSGDYSSKL